MPPRLSNREKALRTIPEARFQKDVEALMTLFGWKHYHTPPNRPGANGRVAHLIPGFPDLIAVRGERMICAELKTQTGKPGPGQLEWLEALEKTGAEVYLWRPEDMSTIREVLLP